MSVNNKTVLVTGASRGIGAAIAYKFASLGYNVVINYLNNEKNALELKNKIENDFNVKTMIIKADVSSEKQVDEMINIVGREYGKIDVLVNNAGICNDCLVEDKTKESFLNILSVNLVGPFLMCQKIIKYLNNGSIINISSTNSIDTYYPYGMDYDASKAGLNILTKNFAKYYAPNIRVNAVACGWVNTDMSKELDEKQVNEEKNHCLLQRFANPDEIANVVCFLASDEASYINGEIIRVDGGYNG